MEASKGDKPVAEDVRTLWAYSAQGRTEDYEAGLEAMMQHRVASSSWLSLSVCPFVCG